MYIVLLVLIAVAGACLGAGHSAFAQMPAPLDEAQLKASGQASAPGDFTEEQFKAAGHKSIDNAHLRELLIGNTAYIQFVKDGRVNKANAVVVHYFQTSGRLLYVNNDGQTGKRISGDLNWWIDKDRYCVSLTDFSGKPMVTCRTFYDLGGVIYGCINGRCSNLIRIVPGNPENL